MVIGGKEVIKSTEFVYFTQLNSEVMRMETGVKLQRKTIIYKLNSTVNSKNE